MSEFGTNRYLIAWDRYGIEVLYDLGQWEKRNMWAILSDEKLTAGVPNLKTMIQRGMQDKDRAFEIYIYETDYAEQQVRELFQYDVALAASMIRSRGDKIFSTAIKKYSLD